MNLNVIFLSVSTAMCAYFRNFNLEENLRRFFIVSRVILNHDGVLQDAAAIDAVTHPAAGARCNCNWCCYTSCCKSKMHLQLMLLHMKPPTGARWSCNLCCYTSSLQQDIKNNPIHSCNKISYHILMILYISLSIH